MLTATMAGLKPFNGVRKTPAAPGHDPPDTSSVSTGGLQPSNYSKLLDDGRTYSFAGTSTPQHDAVSETTTVVTHSTMLTSVSTPARLPVARCYHPQHDAVSHQHDAGR